MTTEELVKQNFEQVLNRHGYGFQYSVLTLASQLFEQRKSQWVFEVTEFPVQVQGYGTRIDFVLVLKTPVYPRLGVYLLAECKRANPAYSAWCFAQAPFVRRNQMRDEGPNLEQVIVDEQGHGFSKAQELPSLTKDTYHVALEIKTEKKGDPCGSGKGVIEDAATQVCRGLNGMIEFLYQNVQILVDKNVFIFLPVIFTTAELWASDANLGDADILTGEISLQNLGLERKSWLLYQYHISPGLKHSHPPVERPNTLSVLMATEYIRTIAIVNAAGIEQFLSRFSNPELYVP